AVGAGGDFDDDFAGCSHGWMLHSGILRLELYGIFESRVTPSDKLTSGSRTRRIVCMRTLCCTLLLLLLTSAANSQAHSYLFAWGGDDAKKGSDFLAVIDADPASSHYGQTVASVAVPGPTGTPHHTELEMPDGGFLLANAFESGRSLLF